MPVRFRPRAPPFVGTVHEFGTGHVGATLAVARADAVREFDTGHVGATLAVARLDAVREFDTGRDKPVPYNRTSPRNSTRPAISSS